MKIQVKNGLLEYKIIKKRTYCLQRCFIAPYQRRKGIATRLIGIFLAKHKGFVYANIIFGDTVILKILKTYGFKKIGKSKNYTNCDEYFLNNR